jgi:hypothetical protein
VMVRAAPGRGSSDKPNLLDLGGEVAG